ncbi:MAG: hypothetical protein LBB94_08420 [Clostridiales bacterium]|jgi:hypothetical protein|nr:hypothetical protein [Clostridiales bacterium]
MESKRSDNPIVIGISETGGTTELLDKNEPFTDESAIGKLSVKPAYTRITVTAEKAPPFEQFDGVMPEFLVNLKYPPFLFIMDSVWLAAAVFTPVNLIRLTPGVISRETIDRGIIICLISIAGLLLIPYIFVRRGGGHLLIGVNKIDSLLHITWALPLIFAGALAFLTGGFNEIFLFKAIVWGQVFIGFFWLALTALAWWFSADGLHSVYLKQFHLKMAVSSVAICCITNFFLAFIH